MAKLNKNEVLKVIVSSAKLYKKNLENKNLLIVSKRKSQPFRFWELKFEKKQFKHLIGIDTTLSSTHFYRKSLTGKLSVNDFQIRTDGTTELKLSVLPSLLDFKNNVRMIGDFEDCSPKLFTEVLAGNIQGALGFVHDNKDNLVPNTCLKCNTNNRVDAEKIVLILSKGFANIEYSNIEYIAEHNFNIEELKSFNCIYKDTINLLFSNVNDLVAVDSE